jgi:hypothetical protein
MNTGRSHEEKATPHPGGRVKAISGNGRVDDGSPGQKPHAAKSCRGEHPEFEDPDSLLIGVSNYEPVYKSSRFQATTSGPALRACLTTSFANPPAATYSRIVSRLFEQGRVHVPAYGGGGSFVTSQ